MIDVYERTGSSVVAVMQVPWEETEKYGIVDFDDKSGDLRIRGLVEKPPRGEAPSNWAVVGRYVFTPEIFRFLEKAVPGRGGEIQLTDSMQQLNAERAMIAWPFRGRRYDIGDKFGFVQATVDLALDRPDLAERVRAYLRERLARDE
jgi:UTP--glucose-1-phosphate uridylyltransferase